MSEFFRRRWPAVIGALRAIAWHMRTVPRDDRWANDVDAPAERIGTLLCNDVVLAVARMKFRRLAQGRRRGFKAPLRR